MVRHRSYTLAARELRLTQPAVSAQVRALERMWGVPFFERVVRQVSPTAAGRELYGYAQRISGLFDELDVVMRELQGLDRGHVSLATVSTAGSYILPPLLGAFRSERPGITISLEVTNRAVVHQRLANNEVDLTIMGRPPEGVSHVARPFLADELVVIAANDSPLARLAQIPLKRLAEEPFVMREAGSGTRLAAENVFRRRRIPVKTYLELGSLSAVKEAVAAGLGVSVLSRHALRMELALRRLAVLAVEGFPLKRQWYLVHSKDKRLSQAAQAFLSFLEERAEKVLAAAGVALALPRALRRRPIGSAEGARFISSRPEMSFAAPRRAGAPGKRRSSR